MGTPATQGIACRNVDTSAFAIVPGGRTAAVLVQVPDSGDSAVTVTRTSTTLHTLRDIDRARGVLATAAVTIIQLELDTPVITTAAQAASGIKIGTLAPLQPTPETLFSSLDMIVVNAAEAQVILGIESESLDGPGLAKALTAKGIRTAVVTLGAHGAAFADSASANLVHADKVTVRNTTGAGDAFLGVLALNLARAVDLPVAVKAAIEAATRHVQ